jgi:hypothetical protein
MIKDYKTAIIITTEPLNKKELDKFIDFFLIKNN